MPSVRPRSGPVWLLTALASTRPGFTVGALACSRRIHRRQPAGLKHHLGAGFAAAAELGRLPASGAGAFTVGLQGFVAGGAGLLGAAGFAGWGRVPPRRLSACTANTAPCGSVTVRDPCATRDLHGAVDDLAAGRPARRWRPCRYRSRARSTASASASACVRRLLNMPDRWPRPAESRQGGRHPSGPMSCWPVSCQPKSSP